MTTLFLIIPPFVIETPDRSYSAERLITPSDAEILTRLWLQSIFDVIEAWIHNHADATLEQVLEMSQELQCSHTIPAPSPDPIISLAAEIATFEDFMHYPHEDLIQIARARIESQLRAAQQLISDGASL